MDRTARQKIGVKRWVESKCTATWVWATGVGKTRGTIFAIQLLLKHNPSANILIIVPTKYLQDQWTNELIKWSVLGNCTIQVINTAIKSNHYCDLLVIDEAHRVASDSFKAIFNVVKYNFILCLTATIERLDGKEIIIKKYAPVCDTITLDEAEKEGWISPIKNYVVLLKVDLSKYEVINKEFNATFAYFDWNYTIAMNCLQNWKYRNTYARKLSTTPKVVLGMAAKWMKALHARKDFIENHPSKIDVAREIIDARSDKKIITFCPNIKFAEKIKRGNTFHSGKKASENQQLRESFNKASKGVINTSKALNEGADIEGLTVGIKMNVNSSKITATQQQGRVCRFAPGKVAEMFTILIADTQEVKWFANSAPSNYIVLDTKEKLHKVLHYENIECRQYEFNEDVTYRF